MATERTYAPCAGVYERILAGQKPDRIVWQNKKFGILMARDLVRRAHVLIVPRDCYPTVDHLPKHVRNNMAIVSRHIGNLLMGTYANTNDANGRDRVISMFSGSELSHVHEHRVFMQAGEPDPTDPNATGDSGNPWGRWGRTEEFLDQTASERDATLDELRAAFAGERQAAMEAELHEEALWQRVRGFLPPLPGSVIA